MVRSRVIDDEARTIASTRYGYDPLGRRALVQDNNAATLRTLYDGLGFDVVKESPVHSSGGFVDTYNTGIQYTPAGFATGERYRYLDDGQGTSEKYQYIEDNAYQTVSSRYTGERTMLYANGSPVAVNRSSGTRGYLGTDILGSTRSVTDNHGVQESFYDYDIFGSPITGNYTTGADYGYLGKPYDSITGLYNYGYRDYSPQVVRFTTVDPIRDGSNWFAYVNNDPVNYVDLWGLLASDGKIDWIKEVSDVIGVKFGAQVSAGINVPNVFSFEVEIDLLSVNYEDGIGSFQSGVNMSVSIGNEYLPIGESSIGYEKEVEMSGSQTAFDLLNTNYKFVSETTVNQDFTVTIPTKFGLSVDVNFTELSDLIIKSGTQLINLIKK
ncbi:MAG: RHS repeat-associated core domain-containing protein [Treponema sp.]|nr:RHS repeat-associated core domain-containing protein [Treponema sp.]